MFVPLFLSCSAPWYLTYFSNVKIIPPHLATMPSPGPVWCPGLPCTHRCGPGALSSWSLVGVILGSWWTYGVILERKQIFIYFVAHVCLSYDIRIQYPKQSRSTWKSYEPYFFEFVFHWISVGLEFEMLLEKERNRDLCALKLRRSRVGCMRHGNWSRFLLNQVHTDVLYRQRFGGKRHLYFGQSLQN